MYLFDCLLNKFHLSIYIFWNLSPCCFSFCGCYWPQEIPFLLAKMMIWCFIYVYISSDYNTFLSLLKFLFLLFLSYLLPPWCFSLILLYNLTLFPLCPQSMIYNVKFLRFLVKIFSWKYTYTQKCVQIMHVVEWIYYKEKTPILSGPW